MIQPAKDSTSTQERPNPTGTGYVGLSNTVVAQHKSIIALDIVQAKVDVSIANRQANVLEDAAAKIYTRDLFGSD